MLVLVYGLVVYAVFLAVFATLFVFVGEMHFFPGIDTGAPTAPAGESLAIDVALIAGFGITHSVLARAPVKRVLARVIPTAAVRSTYVLVASAMLALLVWQWRTVPMRVWHVDGPEDLLMVPSEVGAVLIVYSTWLTNHFDLFGVRQVWLYSQGRPYMPVPFVEKSLYLHVRHPMMLGMLLWMWLTPTMTLGHLVFAAGMTAYIAIGIALEERGLVRELGATYEDYRRRVPALVPWRRR